MSHENNFDSLERLLEFGMSMAVAQQMVQTMNIAMQKVTIPQFNQLNVQLPLNKDYYIVINDVVQGPFSENQIREYITKNIVTVNTLIWFQGLPSWFHASQISELSNSFVSLPHRI